MARFKQVDGVRRQMTAEEEAQRDIDEANAIAEQQANGYKRKRREEYPPIVDQLDDIYHNGIDAWKATIKVTKDKYPKS